MPPHRIGLLPPTFSQVPFANTFPPAQNELLITSIATYVFEATSYSVAQAGCVTPFAPVTLALFRSVLSMMYTLSPLFPRNICCAETPDSPTISNVLAFWAEATGRKERSAAVLAAAAAVAATPSREVEACMASDRKAMDAGDLWLTVASRWLDCTIVDVLGVVLGKRVVPPAGQCSTAKMFLGCKSRRGPSYGWLDVPMTAERHSAGGLDCFVMSNICKSTRSEPKRL